MTQRLVSVGDDFTLPAAVKAADANLPARLQDTALNATYAPKVTGGYLPVADAEANYAQLSSLAATFRPATTRQQQPAESIITTFSSGHLWATSGTGVTWDLNYTADAYAGSQCVRGTTLGTNVEGSVQSVSRTPTIDLTNKVLVLPVKVVSGLAHISTLRMLLSDNNFTANSSVSIINGASVVPPVIREGEWYTFRFTLADITSSTGTPNLGAVNAIRIALRDKGTGVAVVELGKLSYYTPPSATAFPNGAVTLWFDDSYASHRTIAAPHMAKYGFAGSEAVICDKIDSTGMTLTQLKELADSYGWEINPHSYTVASHAAGFTSLTEAQLVDEVNSIKSWMASNGFGANDHIAYPLGQHNATTDEVLGRYFSTARTTNPLPLDTMLTGNRLRTRCVATDNTTTLAGMQAVIDRAYRAGVWLQIYFHDIVADGTANTSTKIETTIFKGIIDYLNTKGSRVMTAGDVWNAGL